MGLIPIDPALAKGLGEPFVTPAGTVDLFLAALRLDANECRTVLQRITTPESWDAWGDFAEAQAMLADIDEDLAIQSIGARPEPDVAYIGIMRNPSGETYYVDGDVPMNAVLIVSLVDRPSLGGWRVHSFGKGYWPADDLPRD